MAPTYEILVAGSSAEWSGGFMGFANLTLVTTSDGTLLFDTGHYINRGALIAALAHSSRSGRHATKAGIIPIHERPLPVSGPRCERSGLTAIDGFPSRVGASAAPGTLAGQVPG